VIVQVCPRCGGRQVRCHRRLYEKPFYAETVRCTRCEHRSPRGHTRLARSIAFMLALHARCPRCGRHDVHTGSKLDRIDSQSRHPLSLLQRLLLAPLRKCHPCRLQFYDWRPVKVAAPGAGTDAPGVNHQIGDEPGRRGQDHS
jgi:hypothetical protein